MAAVKSGKAIDILNKRVKETLENDSISNDREVMGKVWDAINSKAEEDDSGYDDYLKACDVFDLREGELVYFKGVRSYPVIHNGFSYMLGENTFSKDILQSLFQSKAKYERFIKYILKTYNLKSKPVLRKLAYMVNPSDNDAGFVFRKDLQGCSDSLNDLIKKATTVSTGLDKETSSYVVYVPMIPVRKANNEIFNEMLNIMFGANDIDIKRYVAVYAFENRYEISRPTLVLSGDRGTGKSTFIEGLLGKIYEGMSCQMSTSDQFNDYLDNKLAFLDEVTEQGYDISFMYDFLKQLSGQSRVLVNTKNMPKFQIKNGIYIAVASNDVKPLHIKDEITSERNNQFLVIKMCRTRDSEDRMEALELKIHGLGYRGLRDFMDDNLGHYLFTEILDIYKAMRKLIKGKNYRYGLPIPITEGLRQLLGMSVSENDMASMRIIESLFFCNKKMYSDRLLGSDSDLFEFFSKGIPETNLKGFLAFQILREMLSYERIKVSVFKRFVTSNGFVVSGNLRVQCFAYQQDYSSVQGMVLDIDAINKYIQNQINKSHLELSEKVSNMRHQEVIEQERAIFVSDHKDYESNLKINERKSTQEISAKKKDAINIDDEEMSLLDKLL